MTPSREPTDPESGRAPTYLGLPVPEWPVRHPVKDRSAVDKHALQVPCRRIACNDPCMPEVRIAGIVNENHVVDSVSPQRIGGGFPGLVASHVEIG